MLFYYKISILVSAQTLSISISDLFSVKAVLIIREVTQRDRCGEIQHFISVVIVRPNSTF